MVERVLEESYGLRIDSIEKAAEGAGSNTYFICSDNEKYVLKNPDNSSINNPELEPELCEFLLNEGIYASKFIRNRNGEYITRVDNQIYHMQKHINGIVHELNRAPDWLMIESAELLGKIHTVLEEYKPLPEGIGKGFFEFMTPERAKDSYLSSLDIARDGNKVVNVSDLEYRIQLMDRFPIKKY